MLEILQGTGVVIGATVLFAGFGLVTVRLLLELQKRNGK